VLTWSLFELSRHPDVMAEVTAEVDAVLGDRIPTYEDVKALQVRGQKQKPNTTEKGRLVKERERGLSRELSPNPNLRPGWSVARNRGFNSSPCADASLSLSCSL
jgi:hypothetical protein